MPLRAQAPAQPAAAGVVVGVGNFGHIVADLDKSLGFYRDVLGLTVTGTIPYGPNEAVAKFGHTEGGQSRVAVLRVPGLAMGVELIEYKDIERKAQPPRFDDPGAANLALRVAISMGCSRKSRLSGREDPFKRRQAAHDHHAERCAARGVCSGPGRLCRGDA